MTKKVPKTKNVVKRDLLACIEERFNGFKIIYKPVSKISQTINYYFSKSMRNAYRVVSDLKKGKDVTSADQRFACNKFFIQKKSLERHLQVSGYMPGIIYKFENQNMQTFSDYMKFMGDLPFSIFFAFETTCRKKSITLTKTVAFTLSLILL